MITQLMRISDTDFQHTFYTSGAPDENTCFTGNCKQYCDDYHPVCGNGEILEVSFPFFVQKKNSSDASSVAYHL